jgi:hypothetical protein
MQRVTACNVDVEFAVELVAVVAAVQLRSRFQLLVGRPA